MHNNIVSRTSEIDMSELRNRSQVDDDEEHEVLIEPSEEDEQIKKAGKTGVAGDERNILVLLFLYILQVLKLNTYWFSLSRLFRESPLDWQLPSP